MVTLLTLCCFTLLRNVFMIFCSLLAPAKVQVILHTKFAHVAFASAHATLLSGEINYRPFILQRITNNGALPMATAAHQIRRRTAMMSLA